MNQKNVLSLFDQMWSQYVTITPSAHAIHALLSRGDPIINDHVAYRTFNHPAVGLNKLGALLLKLGFEERGEYHFKAKKLYARHYQHSDPVVPKIFVSELLLQQCSERMQTIVAGLLNAIPQSFGNDLSCFTAGVPWRINRDDYECLAAESEYAGWLSAFGYRANHFTVSVNHLPDYENLQAVVEVLRKNQFKLNESGGVIKGSPEVYLEQASTMADLTTVSLADAQVTIPGCFYEFAYRHLMPSGELYHGFVETSADKIFESTNKGS